MDALLDGGKSHSNDCNSNQERIILVIPTNPTNVRFKPDQRLHYPLPFLDPMKIEALQFLFLAQNQVVSAHNQQVAVNFLTNFFFHSIVHVSCIARVQLVNDNTFWKLNRWQENFAFLTVYSNYKWPWFFIGVSNS